MTGLKVVALAGGVGGARLADGMAQVLQPEDLTVIVNTGDDFTHMGLRISPDLDTVCYTLAGMENPDTGWGRIHDTWSVYNLLKQMGMPDWFNIGDNDLATHIVRTVHYSEGWPLSKITQEFCHLWGIRSHVIPMTDDLVQTYVLTDDGEIAFQEYFVHQKCMPVVKGFTFKGIENCSPAPGVIDAIHQADVIVICPSNPWVSIDPILANQNIRIAIEEHWVIAVSPIIGGKTIKGPAAKMFSELGIQPSAFAVAQHYDRIIDGLFIDHSDSDLENSINSLGIDTYITDIFMHDRSDRIRFANEIIRKITGKKKVSQ